MVNETTFINANIFHLFDKSFVLYKFKRIISPRRQILGKISSSEIINYNITNYLRDIHISQSIKLYMFLS